MYSAVKGFLPPSCFLGVEEKIDSPNYRDSFKAI